MASQSEPDIIRVMQNNNDNIHLDLTAERELLANLRTRRDAVSDWLMEVTLDGDDPTPLSSYQMMLGRERRLDIRIAESRQAIRELKAAGAIEPRVPGAPSIGY